MTRETMLEELDAFADEEQLDPDTYEELRKALIELENSSKPLTDFFNSLMAELNRVIQSSFDSRHKRDEADTYVAWPQTVANQMADAIERMSKMTADELRAVAAQGSLHPSTPVIEPKPEMEPLEKGVVGDDQQLVEDTAGLMQSIGESAVKTFRGRSLNLQ